MWGGETLDPLTDDQGPHCVFKSYGRAAIAFIFFSSVGLCITHCFLAVVLSSYVKQASQSCALLVSTGAAVANTAQHVNLINECFIRAIGFFTMSAALILWLFVGLPSRIPFIESTSRADGVPDELRDEFTHLYDGEVRIMCIDRFSPTANRHRDRICYSIACANTIIILVMFLWGYRRFRLVRESYEPGVLLEWWAEHRADVAQQQEELLRGTKQKAASGSKTATSKTPTAASGKEANGRTRSSSLVSERRASSVKLLDDGYHTGYYAHESDADST